MAVSVSETGGDRSANNRNQARRARRRYGVAMDADRSLAFALDAAAFIESMRTAGPEGSVWRRAVEGGDAIDRTVYHGSAGIVLFLLELSKATGDRVHLERAADGGREIVGYVSKRTKLPIGPHTGWPGYAFVLEQLSRATGDVSFRSVARSCLDRAHAQSTVIGSGIGWIEPMPFSDITGFSGDREIFDQSVGSAGAGLVFLDAHRSGLHPDARAWAIAAADRLLEVAEHDAVGLRWRLMSDMPFPFTAPNFAHGGAGVGYFLADLFRETGDQRYLDAAIAGARYVQSRATATGDDGVLVCHTEEPKKPFFYLGACHGPAGTGRLFHLLHDITGDAEWIDWMHRLNRGLLSTGAPERRSIGLWNNVGQCCGDAGIGDYALQLERTTGEAMYHDLADRVAQELASRSVEGPNGGRCWPQAEHRMRADFIETQTGYMQGAAGIGSFFLHHATSRQGRPVKIVLPDQPFAMT